MISKNEQNSFDRFVSLISSEKLGIIPSDFRDEWVELIKECIDTKVPVDDAINEITSCIGFAFGAQCILSKFVPDPNWKLDCLQTILKRDGQKIPIFTAPNINDAIGNYIKSNYFSNLKYSELPGLRIAVVSSLVEWRFYAFNPEDKSTWIQDFDFTEVKNDKDIQELLKYMLVMFAYDQDVIKERGKFLLTFNI